MQQRNIGPGFERGFPEVRGVLLANVKCLLSLEIVVSLLPFHPLSGKSATRGCGSPTESVSKYKNCFMGPGTSTFRGCFATSAFVISLGLLKGERF
jgi:hypothetical protein